MSFQHASVLSGGGLRESAVQGARHDEDVRGLFLEAVEHVNQTGSSVPAWDVPQGDEVAEIQAVALGCGFCYLALFINREVSVPGW